MHSIRPQRISRVVLAAALEDEFDALRDEYLARLQGDRLQLAVFAAALARAEGDAARLFGRLRRFAHEAAGVATIFQTPLVAETARSLELASAAAASAHAHGSDPSVWAALVALTNALTSTCCGHSDVAAGDAPS